jgi:hypothetical protein
MRISYSFFVELIILGLEVASFGAELASTHVLHIV